MVLFIVLILFMYVYRLGPFNSKLFISRFFIRIKWNSNFKHGMILIITDQAYSKPDMIKIVVCVVYILIYSSCHQFFLLYRIDCLNSG